MTTTNTYQRNKTVDHYDLLRDIPASVMEEYAKVVLSKIWLKPNTSILDFGFGTGSVLIPLIKFVPKTVQIYGVDISEKMHAKVNRLLGKIPENVTLFKGTLPEFTKKFGRVNVVHFKAVLHCIKDIDLNDSVADRLLDDLDAALCDDGRIITTNELSQTEDALEQLESYKYDYYPPEYSIGNEVASVFKHYFLLRKKMGKPFLSRRFPAGDSEKIADFLENSGKFHGVSTKNYYTRGEARKILSWEREVSLFHILESMRLGTFGVFYEGLNQKERDFIYKSLLTFCKSKHFDIHNTKKLFCRLQFPFVLRKGSRSIPPYDPNNDCNFW